MKVRVDERDGDPDGKGPPSWLPSPRRKIFPRRLFRFAHDSVGRLDCTSELAVDQNSFGACLMLMLAPPRRRPERRRIRTPVAQKPSARESRHQSHFRYGSDSCSVSESARM